MAKEVQHIPVEIIERFMIDVLQGLGVSADEALICKNILISSDLRGIESHGVGRLKYYYDRIKAGVQFTKTQFEVVQETDTTALVDGHHGMGHVIGYRAMRMAIDKAKKHGVGVVTVRNSAHFGIAGYYPLMAAAEGLMGFTVTNARPAIAPTFGTEPMLGTNPIAFAAPSDMPFPFCFDGATPIVQRGKVEVYARAEKPMPEGWMVDAEGNPAIDPAKVLKDLDTGNAAFLPLGGQGETLGGHKGYGLATMVEVLCASLNGGAFLRDLQGVAPDGSRRPYMVGHFFLAIDIARFIPVEASRHVTGQIMRDLQGSRREPGQDRIYVAGEKEYESEKRVRAQGIAVNPNLRRELQIMRDDLKIKGYEKYF